VLPPEEQPLIHNVVAALPGPDMEECMKSVKIIADVLREEGAERARAEAEIRVRAITVGKLLRLKFGSLPDAITERLARASAAELDGIAEPLLFADTLPAALDAR
jgi:hypothetical protein